jgi:hypothetical protein
MSEANLKQAFRNLVKAHIAHAASKNHGTPRNAATSTARKAFQTALNTYVKGTVTQDMRIRYLLNKHYTTNVNKNYLVSLLKTTPANKDKIQKYLSETEGYVVSNTTNSNGKRSIRHPVGAGIHKIQKLAGKAGKAISRIPGATGTGMRRLFGRSA